MGRFAGVLRGGLLAAFVAFAAGVHATSAHAFTVYKVTNTNDSGDGSLRRAINEARKDPGIDAIFFKIPGPGVHTIQPLSDLPDVADHIAGDSQPGYSGTPLIQLDGSKDASAFPSGLLVRRGIVFGLDVVNFTFGIEVRGPASILANVVGADPGGTIAMPNAEDGIVVALAQGATIGDGEGHGNLASGNGELGIHLIDASDTTVEGNMVGTTSSGGHAMANGFGGILVECDSSGVVVGGPGAARNVVSGNADAGVAVLGSDCGTPDGTVVQGNMIGLDGGGTFPIPNAGAGVLVGSASNTRVGTWPTTGNVIAGNQGPGVDVVDVQSGSTSVDSNLIGVNSSGGESVPNAGPGVLIEGSDSTRIGQRVAADHKGDPNVISGNQGGGIRIVTSDMTNVFGNRIGVGSKGVLPVPNQAAGVVVQGGADTHIGGGLVGQGNVIGSNTGDGVEVLGDDATGTPALRVSIQGNWIGTDRAAKAEDGNGGNGIEVLPKADGTRIGNVVGSEGPNVIAHNSLNGVRVATSVGVRIRGNSMFENGQLGIELVGGANHVPVPPTITNVKLANGQLTVKGTLAGVPSRDYSIEVFANASCDPSGSGEGQSFLAGQKVTTDSSGNAALTIKFPYSATTAPPIVTATDTNSKNGDTSQFSQCK